MSKYTSTSIEYFERLSWKRGMLYYIDIADMSQEESEAISTPESTPQQGMDNIRSMYKN